MNRPPYQKDAGIAGLFEKAQAIYREIGKELKDVALTGGGSDGNFTAALGIPTLDGWVPTARGAHAAYEQIYYSSLVRGPTSARGCWRRSTDGDGLFRANTRAIRVIWVLEEIGVKADIKSMPYPPRKHAPDYFAVQSDRNVPLLIDGEVR